MRRKRKSKTVAPVLVRYTRARDPADGRLTPCVWAQCLYGGHVVGPCWGHHRRAVGRALLALTAQCPCGRLRHKMKQAE